jgi:hypothetical protein
MNLAPNGKPSNLNAEQYKLVRTSAFKKWFGDWENAPEKASKVVDENGEPLVVYHGTYVENPFYIFDFDKADLGFHFGTYEQAKNRSETKLFFKGRKSIVNSFFLNIKTIFEATDIGEWEYPQRYLDMFMSDNIISENEFKKNGFQFLYYKEDNKKIRNFLIKKYNDKIGFQYNNKYEGKGKSYIVIQPNQIKLADGTNTTFDGSNDDIRFKEGGLIAPNGQVSNLTPVQYELVRSNEFKVWFGDWENDPKNASKVVDENGEPKPQSHFTDNKFNKFKYKESGFHFGDKSIRDDLSIAKGQNLSVEINAFLNIKNPLRIDDMSRFTPDKITEKLSDKGVISDEKFDELQQIYYELDDDEDSLTKQSNKLIKAMNDLGYDGFVYENKFDSQDSKISYLIDDSSSKIYVRNDTGVFKGDVILLSDSDRKPFLVFTDLNGNEYAVVNNEGEELTLVDKIKIKNMLNSDYYISVVNSPKTHKDYDLFLSDKLFLDSWIAFNSNQIKLADGSNTTFDGSNDDIRYEQGGNLTNWNYSIGGL